MAPNKGIFARIPSDAAGMLRVYISGSPRAPPPVLSRGAKQGTPVICISKK